MEYMSDLYKKVEKFVIDSFNKAGKTKDVKHLKRTVYWVKQLKPNADDTLLIAAVSHDIERAFRDKNYTLITNKGFNSEEHLFYHQSEGARLITDFLDQQQINKKFIEKVKILISKHEIGGDFDIDILKDADSISFFENNVDIIINKFVSKMGRDKVKGKFDWMFERITNNKARQIVLPWYKNALEKIGY